MSEADSIPGATGPFLKLTGGAPEGYDALVLARQLAASTRPHLHVVRDDARLTRLRAALDFFAPGLKALSFPAWDCLPYDRVSPNPDVMSQRMATLAWLAARSAESPQEPVLVLTTVSAFLQRVPEPAVIAAQVLTLTPGEVLAPDALIAHLAGHGFRRTETVREPGEFAVRGGIIDLFPPGSGPARVDFFGDRIEQIRGFDPASQRSSGTLERLVLAPISEVVRDAAAIERFRSGYRAAFGAVTSDDPLYEAISAGRPYQGEEHWLPLFHKRLVPLDSYLPEATISIDFQAEAVAEDRLALIADCHRARLEQAGHKNFEGVPVYQPLPPEALYLEPGAWHQRLQDRGARQFSPFPPASPDPQKTDDDAGGRLGRDFSAVRGEGGDLYQAVSDAIDAHRREGRHVIIAAYSPGARDRLHGLLRAHIGDATPVEDWPASLALGAPDTAPPAMAVLPVERGFSDPHLAVISEEDILGERLSRPPRRRSAEQFIAEASALGEGDLVVHQEHGIGRYEGLETLDVGGGAHDCLRLTYAGGDKLFVPVENIEILSRYGPAEGSVSLDRLGGVAWQSRRARAKKRIRDIADELLRLAAQRGMTAGPAIAANPDDYAAFAAGFPYAETEDQERAIAETLADMAAGPPMDRLVCGDVGFGKTEVALRAAFATVSAGFQVAVIAPTTLLCRQHEQLFRARFARLPVRIAQLSRLVPPAKAAAIREETAAGKIDILIGTHALLSKDMSFDRLGLLVVDEEQRFGVRQKERLKTLSTSIHVLTLTATPIPRTLQQALSGVREMSLITTPPVDRLAVRTFILPYDPVVVREAIARERARGGQIYYVCPRVSHLADLRKQLAVLAPDMKVGVAHGGMAPAELEKVMEQFYDGAFETLLSTQIIESGLDIPRANTLIVHRADMFGLAQLYQLRGRVGRSKLRAFAYFTLPPNQRLTATANRRLEVLHTLDSLGAGFTLASHDLDIRGAGNLLGEEQSGHIREVGIELYQHMLEEAVAEAQEAARGKTDSDAGGEVLGIRERDWSPQIGVGVPVLIPEIYVSDLGVRLGLYRRLGNLETREEMEAFAAELIDRFGPLPAEVENLLEVMTIKQLCRRAGVEKVEAGPKGAVLGFRTDQFANPAGLVAFIQERGARAKLRPDHRLVLRHEWGKPAARITGLKEILVTLGEIARAPSGKGEIAKGAPER